MISLASFYRMLEAHDWFHMMSDDASVNREGELERSKLDVIAKQSGEHATLLKLFLDYKWDHSKKTPKPVGPIHTD
jgi:hypothetical protein